MMNCSLVYSMIPDAVYRGTQKIHRVVYIMWPVYHSQTKLLSITNQPTLESE